MVGHNRRISYFLQIVICSIETDVNIPVLRIDRSGGSDCILSNKSVEDVSAINAKRCKAIVGKLHEDTFWTLPKEVDLFYAGNVKQILTQRFCFSSEQARGQPGCFERVDRERNVGI